jgi:hypothetical protein
MNNEQKAQEYNMYLSKFTQLGNRIQEIKGQDLELNQQQLEQIQKLEQEQRFIMNKINSMM